MYTPHLRTCFVTTWRKLVQYVVLSQMTNVRHTNHGNWWANHQQLLIWAYIRKCLVCHLRQPVGKQTKISYLGFDYKCKLVWNIHFLQTLSQKYLKNFYCRMYSDDSLSSFADDDNELLQNIGTGNSQDSYGDEQPIDGNYSSDLWKF